MDILVRFLNPILMMVLGLGIGVLVARRLKADWGLYWTGLLAFVGAQVLHIPFNQYVLLPWLRSWGVELADLSATGPLLLTALTLGLSAGVFEEVARYLVMRSWKEERRSWNAAVMLGAGHGGIEAVLLGVLVLLTVINLIALRNPDVFERVPLEQRALVQAQLDAFWRTPIYAFLLGAVERAVAICFHLSASVLVLQVFRRRNLVWLGVAIGWHTLLDALAVAGSQRWGIYRTEAILVLFGLASLWILFRLREPAPAEASVVHIEPAPLRPVSGELSEESLEDSRYV